MKQTLRNRKFWKFVTSADTATKYEYIQQFWEKNPRKNFDCLVFKYQTVTFGKRIYSQFCDMGVSNFYLFETSHYKLMANLEVFDLTYMEYISYFLGFKTKHIMKH